MRMPNFVHRPAHKFTPSLTHILLVRTMTCKAHGPNGQRHAAMSVGRTRFRPGVQCMKYGGLRLLDALPQVGVILAVLVAGERAKRR